MTHFWSARPVMLPSVDHDGDATINDDVSLAAASELCWARPLPARAPEHKVPATRDISLCSASSIPLDAF
jgi:hypothetical protein